MLEGTFRIQRAKNERTLFLFDKLLLITKKREETFTYKAHILVWQVALWGKIKGVMSVYPTRERKWDISLTLIVSLIEPLGSFFPLIFCKFSAETEK